jgi:Predicted membrane protein
MCRRRPPSWTECRGPRLRPSNVRKSPPRSRNDQICRGLHRTLVVFLACDSVWLTLTAASLYKATLGDILLPQFLLAPAAVFYSVFIVGVVIFAVGPAIRSGRWTQALFYGALFGFFSYGVYDFTNWATLRNWSWQITAADICWGTILTGFSATLGYLISDRVLRAIGLSS